MMEKKLNEIEVASLLKQGSDLKMPVKNEGEEKPRIEVVGKGMLRQTLHGHGFTNTEIKKWERKGWCEWTIVKNPKTKQNEPFYFVRELE